MSAKLLLQIMHENGIYFDGNYTRRPLHQIRGQRALSRSDLHDIGVRMRTCGRSNTFKYGFAGKKMLAEPPSGHGRRSAFDVDAAAKEREPYFAGHRLSEPCRRSELREQNLVLDASMHAAQLVVHVGNGIVD